MFCIFKEFQKSDSSVILPVDAIVVAETRIVVASVTVLVVVMVLKIN